MPGPAPDGWLPPGAARVSRALHTVTDAIFHESVSGTDPGVLYGLGASRGTYDGPARVVLSPTELHPVRHGDVLVTTSTSPSFNVVLPVLGALVTDFGGTLSHAAIVAREFGIPAVVGTRDATRRIRDGTRVRVDGAAGEVRLLP
jgi:pyruvate,water dikinase